MKRRLLHLFILLCVFFTCSDVLLAGTTGKISGRILDAENNEPLPGVNIIVDGTQMGAATDINGFYQIINLPPGTYTLVMRMIGYTSQRIEGIKVNIDLTTTQNSSLKQTVLQSGEEVTIVAERPIVQMDMTGSLSTVSADEIAILPAQSTNYLIGLTAGVVDAGGIHIRGGRSSEVAYWVDGVATTDAFTNNSTAAVENTAVQELQVISGTYNAEYGQAMSGIINIITKDGGMAYHGELKGYVGDYVSSGSEYEVLKSVTAVTNPATGKTTLTSESEDPLTKFNPTYNIEGSLSGPIPYTKDKLSFFINGRYYQQEGYLYGREWFLPCGIPGDSSLVPLQQSNRWTGLAKLTWSITPGLIVRYSLNTTEYHNDRYFSRVNKYAPRGLSPNWGNTSTHLLTMNHVLSNKTFYELKVNRMSMESESYLYDNPNYTPDWMVYLPGDAVNPARTFRPADEPALMDSLKQYGIQYKWVPNPNQPYGYVSPDSSITPIGYSYNRAGNDLGRNFRSSAYWIGKLDITSQVNNKHQLKGGVELRLHELDLDNYTLRAQLDENGTAIQPFQPVIPDKSSLYRNVYDEPRKPIELSAYIQDKIELDNLIMNIGIRFDYFNSNYYVPVDPMDPSIYTPLRPENKYVNPTAATADLVEYTPEQRKGFMWKDADAKMQVSPRVGIAYPITDKGVIHFSYGHFFQIPDFQYLFAAPGFKLNTGGGNSLFGNANLNPQRTTQYEIGLQQEVAAGVGIDVTIFYRDIRDWVGNSPIVSTFRDVVSYSTFENKDYANVRGVTFRGEQRFSNLFSAMVDYTFQIAEGTYSNPDDAYYAQLNDSEPRRSLIPLNWDQHHTLNTQLMYRPGTWTISFVGKYNTGLPYTPSFAKGAFVGGAGVSALPENSARNPNIYSADIYVTKAFPFGRLRAMLFAYVYNVFDNRMPTSVFSDTGTPEYTTNPRPEDVLYNSLRIGTVEDLYKRPEWYIAPRQVQLGLSLGF